VAKQIPLTSMAYLARSPNSILKAMSNMAGFSNGR
jgi:hypothetical protein